MSHRQRVAQVVVGILSSRVSGLVRTRVLAHFFGVSALGDVSWLRKLFDHSLRTRVRPTNRVRMHCLYSFDSAIGLLWSFRRK